jgi:hypothetical protein
MDDDDGTGSTYVVLNLVRVQQEMELEEKRTQRSYLHRMLYLIDRRSVTNQRENDGKDWFVHRMQCSSH